MSLHSMWKSMQEAPDCLSSDERRLTILLRAQVSPYWTHFPEHEEYERGGQHLGSSIFLKSWSRDKVVGEIVINDKTNLVNTWNFLSTLCCVFILKLFRQKDAHSFKLHFDGQIEIKLRWTLQMLISISPFNNQIVKVPFHAFMSDLNGVSAKKHKTGIRGL